MSLPSLTDDGNTTNSVFTEASPHETPYLPQSANDLDTTPNSQHVRSAHQRVLSHDNFRTERQLAPTSHAIKKRTNRATVGATRGTGFTQLETDNLLHCIERKLPLCKEEWDAVLVDHMKLFSDFNRTVDSLKRKFSMLHRKKMPTGDPLMPDDVRRAKHLRYLMTERADLGVAEETADVVETIMAQSDRTDEDEIGGDNYNISMGNIIDDDRVNSASAGSVSIAQVTPNNEPSETNSPHTAPSTTTSPRPIVHRRTKNLEDVGDIMSIIKASMLQEQRRMADETTRRTEEALRCSEERAEERQRREEDRIDERHRRDQETKRHNIFMETMMMVLSQQSNNSASSKK